MTVNRPVQDGTWLNSILKSRMILNGWEQDATQLKRLKWHWTDQNRTECDWMRFKDTERTRTAFLIINSVEQTFSYTTLKRISTCQHQNTKTSFQSWVYIATYQIVVKMLIIMIPSRFLLISHTLINWYRNKLPKYFVYHASSQLVNYYRWNIVTNLKCALCQAYYRRKITGFRNPYF